MYLCVCSNDNLQRNREGAEKEMKANNNRKLIDETLELAGDNQQLQRNILEMYKTILDLKSEIIKLKDKRVVTIESHYLDEAKPTVETVLL